MGEKSEFMKFVHGTQSTSILREICLAGFKCQVTVLHPERSSQAESGCEKRLMTEVRW